MSGPPATLFSAGDIAARVRSLATEIRADLGTERLVLLGVLKGSLFFLADLARALGEPLEISFVHARSYGKGTVSSGSVALGDLAPDDVRGKSVVVADAILDSGRTLQSVCALVQGLGAGAVRSCVLLDKPARRAVDVRPDWVGFEVPDRFLVGYGLDHAGAFRGLPYVGAIDG